MFQFVSEAIFDKLDYSNSSGMEKFGELVGFKMATVCPDDLLALMDSEIEAPYELSILRKITGVMEGKYPTVTVQASSSRPMKFIWLEYWPGSERLTELREETVDITYEVRDL